MLTKESIKHHFTLSGPKETTGFSLIWEFTGKGRSWPRKRYSMRFFVKTREWSLLEKKKYRGGRDWTDGITYKGNHQYPQSAFFSALTDEDRARATAAAMEVR